MIHDKLRRKFSKPLTCGIHCGRHGIQPLLGPALRRVRAIVAPPEVDLRDTAGKWLAKFSSGFALRSLFIVSLSFGIFSVKGWSAEAVPAPKVRVDFEWEQIVGSIKYEIELYSKEKKLLSKYTSPTSTFSLELVPGAYVVRGRVYDQREAYGSWSGYTDFLVPPKQIEKIEPPPAEVQVDPNTFMGSVALKWAAPIGAHHYKITILDQNGKIMNTVETTQPLVKWSLKPGVYSYKIISFTQDNVAAEPFESPQNIVIKARPVPEVSDINLKEEKQESSLSWKKETPLPTWLRLEYQKHLSSKWHQIKQEMVEGLVWRIPKELKPGKYRASFWHKSPLGDVSAVKNFEFVIKPQEKDLP
ncbi:MAG: hypothetical protein ACXVCY_05025 [Pseudobdellovibrionaceae bacterium]